MSVQKRDVSGISGSNNLGVYSLVGGREREYDFIFRVASERYSTVQFFTCDLTDLPDLVKQVGHKKADYAVLVNTDLRTLTKTMNEFALSTFDKKFFAATSN